MVFLAIWKTDRFLGSGRTCEKGRRGRRQRNPKVSKYHHTKSYAEGWLISMPIQPSQRSSRCGWDTIVKIAKACAGEFEIWQLFFWPCRVPRAGLAGLDWPRQNPEAWARPRRYMYPALHCLYVLPKVLKYLGTYLMYTVNWSTAPLNPLDEELEQCCATMQT